ncbi:hypothetical protein H4R18_002082 [Coemansia javaensis]|uniref:Myb-like domain-containing protein n=1 Tax=Coemansia javaensis TaxID=2761396 RepID=A0A9W8LI86_9FUNG|nr:hypothetical protein H4R18_002082 [Coemansia javaensis]
MLRVLGRLVWSCQAVWRRPAGVPALRQLSSPAPAAAAAAAAAAPDAAVTTERRCHIAEDICFYVAEGQTVPWYRLAAVYKLPQPELQRILDQEDAAAAERQRTLSARVTRRADETHDAARGRSDWEAVAREVDLPLVDCLRLFDPALSSVPVRSLPAVAEWPAKEVRAMKAFIAGNPEALFRGDWRLVGVYMNVDPADCRMRYSSGHSAAMTPGLCEFFALYHERGFTWGEIHRRYPIYPSRHAAKWTQAEAERVREVVALCSGPNSRLLAIELLAREFPEKQRGSIAEKAARVQRSMRAAAGGKASSPKETSAASGGHVRTEPLPWTASDTAKFHRLVNSYGQGIIDWAEVAAALDRTIQACYNKYIRDQCLMADPRPEQADAVDKEVQRQRGLGPDIGWAAVGQVVGLSELECLELCRVDEGKAPWAYSPDTFSQQTADRMDAFIAEHYPPPLAPNFRAVSNYMWIDAGDCVRMAQLLRGEFKWTDEAKAKIIKLRQQGLRFKEIARQLSPALDPHRLAKYYRSLAQPRIAPLTAEERRRIKEIIDENAGKASYSETRRLVAEAFSGSPRGRHLARCVNSYAAAHPFYRARLETLDKTQIANDILSGAAMAGMLDDAI